MLRNAALALSILLIQGNSSYGQAQTDSLVPTIPETQIKPAELSSPYEFLSVSTSADDFVLMAAKLAATNAESAEVQSIAAKLATNHSAMMKGAIAAGKLDKVEIAKPSADGEQKGLLGKLEGLKQVDFDRAYVEAMIFVHQRTIAYYRGYADEGDNLAGFAAASLPSLVEDYGMLVAMGDKMPPADGKPSPAPQ